MYPGGQLSLFFKDNSKVYQSLVNHVYMGKDL